MTNIEEVRASVSLHVYTSLRVGGFAQFFTEPRDAPAASDALRWAEAEALEWTCLGGGTNILFSDTGYAGLVLRLTELRGVAIEGKRVTSASGELLSHVAKLACEAGLSGMEWAWGIPGTVGGAVAMNAGTREGETADILVDAESVSRTGATRRAARSLGFGYRESAFTRRDLHEVVTEATFELAASTSDRALAKAQMLLAERARRLPLGASAGCTFRNPPEGPTAGELLDRAGCKELRVGDAHVSDAHANFIINDGSENGADILELIESMKRRVKEAFGVDLVEEIVVRP